MAEEESLAGLPKVSKAWGVEFAGRERRPSSPKLKQQSRGVKMAFHF